MITQTFHIEQAGRLESVDQLHRRRSQEARRRKVKEAAKPPTLLADIAKRVVADHSVSLETVEQLDAIYAAIDRLANLSSVDAKKMAESLLGVVLRIAWAKASGRPLAGGDPKNLPLKLSSRGVLNTKQAALVTKVLTSGQVASEYQQCTKPLLIWLAW